MLRPRRHVQLIDAETGNNLWAERFDKPLERAAQGIAECEHALALDRNLAHAHSIRGGEAEKVEFRRLFKKLKDSKEGER